MQNLEALSSNQLRNFANLMYSLEKEINKKSTKEIDLKFYLALYKEALETPEYSNYLYALFRYYKKHKDSRKWLRPLIKYVFENRGIIWLVKPIIETGSWNKPKIDVSKLIEYLRDGLTEVNNVLSKFNMKIEPYNDFFALYYKDKVIPLEFSTFDIFSPFKFKNFVIRLNRILFENFNVVIRPGRKKHLLCRVERKDMEVEKGKIGSEEDSYYINVTKYSLTCDKQRYEDNFAILKLTKLLSSNIYYSNDVYPVPIATITYNSTKLHRPVKFEILVQALSEDRIIMWIKYRNVLLQTHVSITTNIFDAFIELFEEIISEDLDQLVAEILHSEKHPLKILEDIEDLFTALGNLPMVDVPEKLLEYMYRLAKSLVFYKLMVREEEKLRSDFVSFHGYMNALKQYYDRLPEPSEFDDVIDIVYKLNNLKPFMKRLYTCLANTKYPGYCSILDVQSPFAPKLFLVKKSGEIIEFKEFNEKIISDSFLIILYYLLKYNRFFMSQNSTGV